MFPLLILVKSKRGGGVSESATRKRARDLDGPGVGPLERVLGCEAGSGRVGVGEGEGKGTAEDSMSSAPAGGTDEDDRGGV